ncbi:MAG: hypothetical protein OHK0044_03340 [Burkholderiaceae bacterium]
MLDARDDAFELAPVEHRFGGHLDALLERQLLRASRRVFGRNAQSIDGADFFTIHAVILRAAARRAAAPVRRPVGGEHPPAPPLA